MKNLLKDVNRLEKYNLQYTINRNLRSKQLKIKHFKNPGLKTLIMKKTFTKLRYLKSGVKIQDATIILEKCVWLIKNFITEKEIRLEITSLIPMYNHQKVNLIRASF